MIAKLQLFGWRLLSAVGVVLLAAPLAAQDFSVDGIYYNITDSDANEVEVTYTSESDYTGSITIPESVTNSGTTYSVVGIGTQAFYKDSLMTAISLPSTVTSIGMQAFSYCTGLTEVEIPSSVTSLSSWAFAYCTGLTSVELPEGLYSLGQYAFYYCTGLQTVTFSESSSCSIGAYAFKGCTALEEIVLPQLTSIPQYTFQECSSLKSIDLPEGLVSIGNYAFKSCTSLTELVLPNSVTTLGSSCFAVCSSLETLTIGTDMSSIGNSAFVKTTPISTVYCYATTVPSLGSNNFGNSPTVWVREELLSEYQSTKYWTNLSDWGIIVEDTVSGAAITTAYNADYNLQVPSGATAYTVSGVKNNTAMLTAIEPADGDSVAVIPAGTAVIVTAPADSVIYFLSIDGDYAAIEDNLLFASATDSTFTSSSDTLYYELSISNTSESALSTASLSTNGYNVSFTLAGSDGKSLDASANVVYLQYADTTDTPAQTLDVDYAENVTDDDTTTDDGTTDDGTTDDGTTDGDGSGDTDDSGDTGDSGDTEDDDTTGGGSTDGDSTDDDDTTTDDDDVIVEQDAYIDSLAEEGVIYLYNVGTGLYVNIGGYWDAQPVLSSTGAPLTIIAPENVDIEMDNEDVETESEDVTATADEEGDAEVEEDESTDYSIYEILSGLVTTDEEGEEQLLYLGYVNQSVLQEEKGEDVTLNSLDYGRLYMNVTDPEVNNGDFFFSRINSDTTIYNISFYVATDENSDLSDSEDAEDGLILYYWVAEEQEDGTYLLSLSADDPTDNEAAQWILVPFSELEDSLLSNEETANAYGATPVEASFEIECSNFHYQGSTAAWTCTVGSEESAFSTESNSTLYIGIGSTDDDDLRSSGQYTVAHIVGASSATLKQTVEVPMAGWYRVSFKGFYLGDDISVMLYAQDDAKSTYGYNYTSLYEEGSTISSTGEYLEAGKLLTDSSTSTTYETGLYVYVGGSEEDGYALTIGLSVEDGSDGWVAFDDVRLQYCGNDTTFIVLDEVSTSLNYLSGQANTDGCHPMVLARTIYEGEWNSLSLPVDLTGEQAITAFGPYLQVSKLMEAYSNGKVVGYSSIDVASVGITHEVAYLIKPNVTELQGETSGATFTMTGSEGGTHTLSQQFYLIPQVSFPSESITSYEVDTELTDEYKNVGTYIYQKNRIPYGSYLMYRKKNTDGSYTQAYYKYVGTAGLDVKGFRNWVEPITESAAEVSIRFAIDGDESEINWDSGESTSISSVDASEVKTDGRIYTLSGQLVATDGNLDALPEGIYVLGGTKYIVR